MSLHLNLQNLAKPTSTFASRFPLPLWNYIVGPRKPEDEPYIRTFDFRLPPLSLLLIDYPVTADDILEVFELDRRVLFTGVQIEVVSPATGLILRPVTDSGIAFDDIDCSTVSKQTYLVGGGILDRATPIESSSIVIDDPDYMGLRIIANPQQLSDLDVNIQLVISDSFEWDAPTNSTKDNA